MKKIKWLAGVLALCLLAGVSNSYADSATDRVLMVAERLKADQSRSPIQKIEILVMAMKDVDLIQLQQLHSRLSGSQKHPSKPTNKRQAEQGQNTNLPVSRSRVSRSIAQNLLR